MYVGITFVRLRYLTSYIVYFINCIACTNVLGGGGGDTMV